MNFFSTFRVCRGAAARREIVWKLHFRFSWHVSSLRFRCGPALLTGGRNQTSPTITHQKNVPRNCSWPRWHHLAVKLHIRWGTLMTWRPPPMRTFSCWAPRLSPMWLTTTSFSTKTSIWTISSCRPLLMTRLRDEGSLLSCQKNVAEI